MQNCLMEGLIWKRPVSCIVRAVAVKSCIVKHCSLLMNLVLRSKARRFPLSSVPPQK